MQSNNEFAILCGNIKLLRERAGLSKREMASILHIGGASLSKIEAGIMPERAGVEVLFTVAKHFRLKVTELFLPIE